MLVAATLAGSACGGGGGSDFAEAFCSDLDAGLSLMNLQSAAAQYLNRDGFEPGEYAQFVVIWVRDACPERLDTDPGIQAMIENWGIDPDG